MRSIAFSLVLSLTILGATPAEANPNCKSCAGLTPVGTTHAYTVKRLPGQTYAAGEFFSYRVNGKQCCLTGKSVFPPRGSVLHLDGDAQVVYVEYPDSLLNKSETRGILEYQLEQGSMGSQVNRTLGLKRCGSIKPIWSAVRAVFGKKGTAPKYELVVIDLRPGQPARVLQVAEGKALAKAKTMSKIAWDKACSTLKYRLGKRAAYKVPAYVKPKAAVEQTKVVVRGVLLKGGALNRFKRRQKTVALKVQVESVIPAGECVSDGVKHINLSVSVSLYKSLKIGKIANQSPVQVLLEGPKGDKLKAFKLERIVHR